MSSMANLGRKQRIKNSEWIEALADIEQKVSKKRTGSVGKQNRKGNQKEGQGEESRLYMEWERVSLVL